MDYIPGGADDLSYLLKRVTFKLHETYPNPSRVIDKPPFRVSETGWGEFTVQIRLQFIPESGEKPLNLSLPIKLHHWGAPIEGESVPVITGPPPASTTATPAAATDAANQEQKEGEGGADKEKDVKPDTAAIDSDGDVKMEEAKDTSTDQAQPEGEGVEGAAEETTVPPPAPQPVSIASKLPVHAWQYDELVFTDPPLNFLNILNENTPTPLPPKNRRARDQRDEAAKKKATKGGRASMGASAVNSRAATAEPSGLAPLGESGSVPPAAQVPAAGVSVGVGIPGEPGSADVPLEFTAEMEKGEWNRLHEARKRIIDEMDRWRWVLRVIWAETVLIPGQSSSTTKKSCKSSRTKWLLPRHLHQLLHSSIPGTMLYTMNGCIAVPLSIHIFTPDSSVFHCSTPSTGW